MSFANNILNTTGTLPISRGGTNITNVPSNGQTLIGNSTDYTCAALSAGPNISITNASGAITVASTVGESAFLAYISSDITNVIGNSTTAYAITSNWTETYDLGNNFSSGTFTAPSNGIYMFNASIRIGSMTSSMTTGALLLQRTGLFTDNVYLTRVNAYAVRNTSTNQVTTNGTAILKLDANDTVKVAVILNGGAGATAGIISAASDRVSYFSGVLLSKL